MSHLVYLERTLGSVHSWPQEILCYLFTTPPTVHTLRDLAAFFFGNSITFITASKFIAECFHASQDDLNFVASKYALWTQMRDTPHLYEYYDMSRGQVVLLRGAEYSDQCVVLEESTIPIKIGLGCNIFPSHIIQKIDETRSNSR